ncbi:MAG: magnesium transporter [Verrucomicrobia bacterium]|nr:magnesium transporter [Verrucomicrobiota bacterium]
MKLESNYNQIRESIRQQQLNTARQHLGQLSVQDTLSILENLQPHEAALAFRLLDRNTMLSVFETLSSNRQAQIIRSMTDEDALKIIGQLETDESVQLFEEMPAKVVKRLVSQLDEAKRESVNMVLGYPDGSAGRRMNPNTFTARRSQTVAETLAGLRASHFSPEDLEVVFVIDKERFFHGYVHVTELLKAEATTKVIDLAEHAGWIVRTLDPEMSAVRVLSKSDLPAVAVLDTENRLVGMLSSVDLVDVAEEEASDLMYRKAGMADLTAEKDHIFSQRLTQGSIWYPVRVRILFLFVTLIGGLLVGGLIDRFEETLAAVLAAAVFIPLVMDMGGNVGTQSTTIFARGFALGHIKLREFRRYLLREGLIGATIGVLLGTLAGIIAYFWQGIPNGIPQIGLAVGVSLAVVITLAAMLGFLLPFIMIKLGFDHAPGADPFITTIKDFSGLALYFFLVATLIGVPEEESDETAYVPISSTQLLTKSQVPGTHASGVWHSNTRPDEGAWHPGFQNTYCQGD